VFPYVKSQLRGHPEVRKCQGTKQGNSTSVENIKVGLF
jgi:hypothetical protein